MLCRRDVIVAAGDDQLILGHDPVARGGAHRETSPALQHEVIFGKDRAVNIAVVDLRKAPAVCQGVGGAVRQRDKDFVRLPDIERCKALAGNIRVIQNEFDLVALLGVHDQSAVAQRTADHIDALVLDRYRVPLDGNRRGSGVCRVLFQRNAHRDSCIIALLTFSVGKAPAFRSRFCHGCRCRRALHGTRRLGVPAEQEHADQNQRNCHCHNLFQLIHLPSLWCFHDTVLF